MVRIENGKIIIEIESPFPIEDLGNYQTCLINAIHDYSYVGEEDLTISRLTELLESLLPTWEQNTFLFSV